MVPYPLLFATTLSDGLFAVYTYTFGKLPSRTSGQDNPVFPTGLPGSHSTVPWVPKWITAFMSHENSSAL